MKCEYIKQDEGRCAANAMTNSKFCFSHNPDVEIERSIAILRGGYAMKRLSEPLPPVTIKNIQDISGLIEDTINRIRTDPMTTHQANAIGYLSGILLKAIDLGQLEERLRKLEEIVKNNDKAQIE
jgi:hypothetical protein